MDFELNQQQAFGQGVREFLGEQVAPDPPADKAESEYLRRSTALTENPARRRRTRLVRAQVAAAVRRPRARLDISAPARARVPVLGCADPGPDRRLDRADGHAVRDRTEPESVGRGANEVLCDIIAPRRRGLPRESRAVASESGASRSAVNQPARGTSHAATPTRRSPGPLLHGGTGFIRETDLHLWSERAKLADLQFSSPDVVSGWLEAELGLAGPGTETT
jgi:hypothetical protein